MRYHIIGSTTYNNNVLIRDLHLVYAERHRQRVAAAGSRHAEDARLVRRRRWGRWRECALPCHAVSNPYILIASAHVLSGGLPLVSDESACDRLIVCSPDAADNPAVVGRVIR